MARLAGHVVKIDALPNGGRPDVLLVHPGDHSIFIGIFIGDAKATEKPGNAKTALRRSRYARFLARYVDADGSGVMALAAPVDDRHGGCECYSTSAPHSMVVNEPMAPPTFSTPTARLPGKWLDGGPIQAHSVRWDWGDLLGRRFVT